MCVQRRTRAPNEVIRTSGASSFPRLRAFVFPRRLGAAAAPALESTPTSISLVASLLDPFAVVVSSLLELSLPLRGVKMRGEWVTRLTAPDMRFSAPWSIAEAPLCAIASWKIDSDGWMRNSANTGLWSEVVTEGNAV